MTNEEIILKNRVFLMEEGVLKSDGTGDTLVFSDEKGTRVIEVPEEIHTFKKWKSLGYIVKKGEHSVARFPIWQKSKKKERRKPEDQEEGERLEKGEFYYMKTAFFFTADQVEPIKA